ncbi:MULTISPECIES: DUF7319 domain-containing protein [Halorussus]|uniref:DUF7319 domain-containing protein n=1 Tax=Halorussus TaxID=1070314 RepID=UPI00209D401E|nr:hypothetical protein [Halorussus vallis]USZ75819.1 hypothetical protein NGM07_00505 [Halorussus vallis]
MADPDSESPREDAPEVDADADDEAASEAERRERLREEVEDKYDFEDFGPRDMAEMSYEEWEAAFDPDTWITGETLLDRVEADLKNRVAGRDVFAVVERIVQDGEPRLLAYSDEGYAVVYPDGSVEGRGTVLRDVKPTVALASMESYEVPEMPDGDVLPDPAQVPEGSGQLGNQLMQIVAAVQLLAGVALLLSGPVFGLDSNSYVIAAVVGLGFLVFSVFVFLLVANARLSDRFRAEEYRNRLRAVGLEDDERPAFLPDDDEALAEMGDRAGAEDVPDAGEADSAESASPPRTESDPN